jgi:uncharacterized membrane protein YcaP (DUF421 family)
MDLVLRATAVFVFVYLITRVIGRRELASLEPFDFILLIVIGDLIQQGVTQSDYSVTGAITVISTFSALDGQPIVLVLDGKVLEGNLARERMTHDELEAEARLQQAESIEDVKLAVLETGGNISIIPKSS